MGVADEIQSDNLIDLLPLKGGQNRGMYRVLQKLQPGGNKPPHPTVANCIVILADDPTLTGILGFNEFTGQYLLLRPPPVAEEGDVPRAGPYPRPWDTADVALILAHIQRIWCSKMNRSALEDAMLAEAARRRFHPVRDWLATLRWDGRGRLDTWLHKAFGAEKSDYTAAVGAKFMIAAVRRVRQPGVKFDCMPVLEGAQGLGKSKCCRALAGDDWFSDSMHPDLGSKDAAIAMVGIWINELAEIQQMIRAELEVFKAFLSRGTDRYRPPYAKCAIDVPRQSVLIGTTNETDYLRDSTGNRRVWPIQCHHADDDWVKANRMHLWAEAAAREAAGESLWLDDTGTLKEAEQAQENRIAEDSWSEKVWEYIGFVQKAKVADIMTHGLNLALKDQDRRAANRVASILRASRWRVKVVREGEKTARWWFHPDHQDYPPI